MIIYVNSKFKKILLILLFLIFSIIIKSEKLSNISGISKLKNFTKLQSIESEKILDFDTQVVLNNNLAYEKENNKLFTGIAIQKIKDNIKNINFYENGNLISYYKYFLDGNIEEAKEIDKEKNQVIIQKYNKNKKIILQKIYENGFLILENQYVNGKLTLEYRANGKENGNFIYYDGNKKVLSEIEVLQINKNGQIYQMPQVIKVFGKNGKIEREYTFKNGTLVGQVQKVYYPNGNLKYTGIAKNDDIIDVEIKELYEEYNSSGAKKMSCKEIKTDKWSCEYYKKDGEIKIKKQIKENFSKNFAASKDIYDNKPGIEFLKSIGKGIGNVFLMIIDGVFGTDMYRSLN